MDKTQIIRHCDSFSKAKTQILSRRLKNPTLISWESRCHQKSRAIGSYKQSKINFNKPILKEKLMIKSNPRTSRE